MFQPKDFQQRILHRLQISAGHLKKVIEMVKKDEYCIDVLHQSRAVQKALQEVDSLMLEHHLKTCATASIRKGEQEKAIQEIMNVLKGVHH